MFKDSNDSVARQPDLSTPAVARSAQRPGAGRNPRASAVCAAQSIFMVHICVLPCAKIVYEMICDTTSSASSKSQSPSVAARAGAQNAKMEKLRANLKIFLREASALPYFRARFERRSEDAIPGTRAPRYRTRPRAGLRRF